MPVVLLQEIGTPCSGFIGVSTFISTFAPRASRQRFYSAKGKMISKPYSQQVLLNLGGELPEKECPNQVLRFELTQVVFSILSIFITNGISFTSCSVSSNRQLPGLANNPILIIPSSVFQICLEF
jgi:hypothetical protein